MCPFDPTAIPSSSRAVGIGARSPGAAYADGVQARADGPATPAQISAAITRTSTLSTTARGRIIERVEPIRTPRNLSRDRHRDPPESRLCDVAHMAMLPYHRHPD